MRNKYWIVFRVDTGCDLGREMCHILDVYDSRIHMRGYPTKRKMLDWIAEWKDGLSEYQMLKPIT